MMRKRVFSDGSDSSVCDDKRDGSNKIFCIGCNKTGTSSLKKTFEDLGYTTGDQRRAEQLMKDYLSSNYQAIIHYCQSAEVFQDFPFSMPGTFKYLDMAYPNSKFILSLRDDPKQWYRSLTKFHSAVFNNGKIMTKEDLLNSNYIYKGWLWEYNRCLYDIPENDPYNKKALIRHYQKYNQEIIEYFKDRPNDLLIINLSQFGSFQKFCSFLGIENPPYNDFPWLNKTVDIIERTKGNT